MSEVFGILVIGFIIVNVLGSVRRSAKEQARKNHMPEPNPFMPTEQAESTSDGYSELADDANDANNFGSPFAVSIGSLKPDASQSAPASIDARSYGGLNSGSGSLGPGSLSGSLGPGSLSGSLGPGSLSASAYSGSLGTPDLMCDDGYGSIAHTAHEGAALRVGPRTNVISTRIKSSFAPENMAAADATNPAEGFPISFMGAELGIDELKRALVLSDVLNQRGGRRGCRS